VFLQQIWLNTESHVAAILNQIKHHMVPVGSVVVKALLYWSKVLGIDPQW
jgi:uncharacterized protein YkwD